VALVPDSSHASSGGGVTVDSYATVTSNVSIIGSGASPTTVVTAAAITADGSTVYRIECFCSDCSLAAAVSFLGGYVYDSSTKVFQNFTVSNNHATVSNEFPVCVVNYLTPSAGSHTYSWRCGKSGGAVTMAADTGTGGLGMPIYIRISHGG
jgi:hypothetical protein